MVYDEGFEIILGNFRLFFFNLYYKKGSQIYSNCSETLIGWIFDQKTKKKGCAFGKKESG